MPYPRTEIDATISNILDQELQVEVANARKSRSRLEGAYDFFASQAQSLFLQEGVKVGTREASAMQRMDADKLAGQTLQERAASDQPQAAPSYISAVPAVVAK